jgi:hypothetical protein
MKENTVFEDKFDAKYPPKAPRPHETRVGRIGGGRPWK